MRHKEEKHTTKVEGITHPKMKFVVSASDEQNTQLGITYILHGELLGLCG